MLRICATDERGCVDSCDKELVDLGVYPTTGVSCLALFGVPCSCKLDKGHFSHCSTGERLFLRMLASGCAVSVGVDVFGAATPPETTKSAISLMKSTTRQTNHVAIDLSACSAFCPHLASPHSLRLCASPTTTPFQKLTLVVRHSVEIQITNILLNDRKYLFARFTHLNTRQCR